MLTSKFRFNPTHRRLHINNDGKYCVNAPTAARQYILSEDAVRVEKGLQRITDPRVALALYMIINYPEIISSLESGQRDVMESALNDPQTGDLLQENLNFLQRIHDPNFMEGLKLALQKVLNNNFVVIDKRQGLPVRLIMENGEKKFHAINGDPVHYCIVWSLCFMRRSSTPNCRISHKIREDGRVTIKLSAICDIKAGDELTIPFDDNPQVVLTKIVN